MKISVLESTLEKSSKEILRGKEKLKNYHLQAAKQYNSMCEDLQTGASHSPIVHQLKERQHSRKDVRREHSGRMVRSKSRQIQKNNEKKDVQPKKHDIGALYSELMAVKSQYKKLKGSYQNLTNQKVQSSNRMLTEQGLKSNESDKTSKEVQKCHKNMQILQCELQRIRKQCLRVVETERFKNKRLQEIIQQKDLTIAYLRRQLDQKKWTQSTSTTSNQSCFYGHSTSEAHYVPSSANCSQISNIVLDEQKVKEQDSLCFSCDPSKQMDSVNSLFANNEKNLKKDRFIVEPNTKTNDPFTEPSQCLTFEQRDEEINQARQVMRMPPRQVKKDQSQIKPKSTKKLKMVTQCDQNVNRNSKHQEPHQKQLMLTGGFTKQRKKASSSRKRN